LKEEYKKVVPHLKPEGIEEKFEKKIEIWKSRTW
jgi:hypothetical protein